MFTLKDCAAAPLLFEYRLLVVGAGFLADVTASGRVLCVREAPDEFWMYGVQPGALAEWGRTEAEAHQAFHRGFHELLIDLASEAPTSEAFEDAVRTFVATVNQPNDALWNQALADVRAGRANTDGLERWPADRPLSVSIAIMREPTPAANVPVEEPRHAVAA